jgi:hypothetical protein
MEILATIKPQAEFLNSAYTWRTQFLRESRDFAAFVGAELGRRTLDYAALFEPWRRAAAGRIAVLPLRDPRAPDTLLARFLGTPGLSRARSLLTEDDLGLIENRSPGPVAVEVCRRLRDQGAHRQLGPRTRDATRFIEDACRQRNLDATPFRGVDPALRATIQSRCRKANDRLAATVWFEPWSARVAPAPEAPVNELARTLDPAALHHVDAIEQAVHDRFALCRDKRFLGLRPGRLLRRLALAHAHR